MKGKDNKKRKKIIVIAATLFLLLLVVEGAICIHFFRPEKGNWSKDKKLVDMLDTYCKAVENGDIDAYTKVFHCEEWMEIYADDYIPGKELTDLNQLCEAMKRSNYKVKNLSYEILGTRDQTEESMIAAVKFKYDKDGESDSKQMNLMVTRGEEYYLTEWFGLNESSVDIDMLLMLVNTTCSAIESKDFEQFLENIRCDEDELEEYQALFNSQNEDLVSVAMALSDYEEIGSAMSYALFRNENPVIRVKIVYQLGYQVSGSTAYVNGTDEFYVEALPEGYMFMTPPFLATNYDLVTM